MKTKDLTVIVCGGRDYEDWPAVRKALDQFHAQTPIIELIQGGQRTVERGTGRVYGADFLAWRWADRARVHCTAVRAEWETYGRAAGPIRNKAMLRRKPAALLAFPSSGPGTRNMVAQARRAGVPVWMLNGDGLFENLDASLESDT